MDYVTMADFVRQSERRYAQRRRFLIKLVFALNAALVVLAAAVGHAVLS